MTLIRQRRPARPGRRRNQRGAAMIEALIAIAVFSIGVMSIFTVIAKMTVNSADARYRTEAAQFAEALLSEMRVANPATRATDYTTGGTAFTAWTNRIHSASTLPLAGTSSAIVPLSVRFLTATSVVVTINWRSTQDTEVDASNNGIPHTYVTTTYFD